MTGRDAVATRGRGPTGYTKHDPRLYEPALPVLYFTRTKGPS